MGEAIPALPTFRNGEAIVWDGMLWRHIAPFKVFDDRPRCFYRNQHVFSVRTCLCHACGADRNDVIVSPVWWRRPQAFRWEH